MAGAKAARTAVVLRGLRARQLELELGHPLRPRAARRAGHLHAAWLGSGLGLRARARVGGRVHGRGRGQGQGRGQGRGQGQG